MIDIDTSTIEDESNWYESDEADTISMLAAQAEDIAGQLAGFLGSLMTDDPEVSDLANEGYCSAADFLTAMETLRMAVDR